MNLQEWTEAYIKYKDSVFRRIKNIERVERGLRVRNKDDSITRYICAYDLKNMNASELSDERISCTNTKSNLEWVLKNWDVLKDTKVIFHFVNLNRADSWSLNPGMHHNITEKSTLKQGLVSLFESVPEMR